MKIYTRTGDRGTTGLFGGQRVKKSDGRLHAYGTIDELNASLGVALSYPGLPQDTQVQLMEIQRLLFVIGSDLATPIGSKAPIVRVSMEPAQLLEKWIDAMEDTLPPLTKFIFPSGSPAGCELHRARTLCRASERWLVELMEKEQINQAILPFLNRLSDYLFVVARYVNRHFKSPERTVEIPRK